MKILNLYIGRNLLVAFGMALVILTFVMISANLLRAFDLIARGVSPATLAAFVVYLLPHMLQFTVPLALLCATVLVFSRLSADRELTAMRASGISIWQIVAPSLLMAVVLSGVCLYLQAELAPEYRYRAENLKNPAAIRDPTGLLEAGRHIEFPRRIVYIGRKHDDVMRDLQIYVLDKQGQITQDLMAERGHIKTFNPNRGEITLALHGVVAVDIVRDASGTEKTRHWSAKDLEHTITMGTNANSRRLTRKPKYMTIRTLLGAIYLAQQQGESASHLYMELHKRLSLAFAPMGFLLMGIPFGLHTRRSETSVGLVISLILAFVFYCFLLLADTLEDQSQYHPEFLVWLPNIIYQLGGLTALHYITKR
ncbi:MAG: LptF/LptG family permease [Candidatus Pacebacteria bacterium]|nr:LptF/LptG family permease [Candidatus Paceibacterota bacterium]